jgi:hypothetical protein
VPQCGILERAVACGDVGRIAGDQVVAFTRERIEPVAADEAHVAHIERAGIQLGQGQRGRGFIGCRDAPARPFARQRERNRTGPGAQIGNTGFLRRQQDQSAFDQQFRFRPRHQHIRRDLQLQRPEFPAARDVGERFAACTARDRQLECGRLCRLQGFSIMGQQCAARAHQRVRQQQLRIERRLQARGCAGQCGRDAQR